MENMATFQKVARVYLIGGLGVKLFLQYQKTLVRN